MMAFLTSANCWCRMPGGQGSNFSVSAGPEDTRSLPIGRVCGPTSSYGEIRCYACRSRYPFEEVVFPSIEIGFVAIRHALTSPLAWMITPQGGWLNKSLA
jgi:hypothetical protein